MKSLFDWLFIIIGVVLSGAGLFLLNKNKSKHYKASSDIINIAVEAKTNELLSKDTDTYQDNLNSDTNNHISSIKRDSDGEFDNILDKHRKVVD